MSYFSIGSRVMLLKDTFCCDVFIGHEKISAGTVCKIISYGYNKEFNIRTLNEIGIASATFNVSPEEIINV